MAGSVLCPRDFSIVETQGTGRRTNPSEFSVHSADCVGILVEIIRIGETVGIHDEDAPL